MSNKFKVGDTIYVSSCGIMAVKVDCPVCFRKMFVTLILGNGDHVEMPCECCGKGFYDEPRGYVVENHYEAGVKEVVVSKVTIEKVAAGDTVKYQSDCHIYYPKDVFATKEEALAESVRRSTEYNTERETKAEFIKGKPNKNYSWNAGYHMRLVKKAKEQIEYHSKMAVICKSRAKGEPK